MGLLRRSFHSLLAMTSEERDVGKECRARRSPYHEKNHGTSPSMTQKVKSRDDKKRKAEIFIEIASVALLPRNDGISAMTEF